VWFQHIGASWRSALEVAAALTPARRILVNSAFTAAGQRRVNPRFATVSVVHPGTRLPTEPRDARRRRGRAALGIGADELAVGIVARLQRWKGQHVVLEGAASLLRARANARLLIIGEAAFGFEPEYPATLKETARRLGIASRVTFTGFRADVPDCLAALDIAVHASITPEPFGLALVEAMAAGTALVAAEGGAVREIATQGTDAILVPPGEPERLAVALLALADDSALRERLAEAGAATARARFDAVAMARTVEAIYREVLRR
jgi:glycosyltransferase involved in cell wall biosynthesis